MEIFQTELCFYNLPMFYLDNKEFDKHPLCYPSHVNLLHIVHVYSMRPIKPEALE